MATAGILVAAARGSATGDRNLDQIPLNSALAEFLQLVQEFGVPGRHTPPMLMQPIPTCQALFPIATGFFREKFAGNTSGSSRQLLRHALLVWPSVPARVASGAPQIQTLEHQPKLTGIHLNMPSPRYRLGG